MFLFSCVSGFIRWAFIPDGWYGCECEVPWCLLRGENKESEPHGQMPGESTTFFDACSSVLCSTLPCRKRQILWSCICGHHLMFGWRWLRPVNLACFMTVGFAPKLGNECRRLDRLYANFWLHFIGEQEEALYIADMWRTYGWWEQENKAYSNRQVEYKAGNSGSMDQRTYLCTMGA